MSQTSAKPRQKGLENDRAKSSGRKLSAGSRNEKSIRSETSSAARQQDPNGRRSGWEEEGNPFACQKQPFAKCEWLTCAWVSRVRDLAFTSCESATMSSVVLLNTLQIFASPFGDCLKVFLHPHKVTPCLDNTVSCDTTQRHGTSLRFQMSYHAMSCHVSSCHVMGSAPSPVQSSPATTRQVKSSHTALFHDRYVFLLHHKRCFHLLSLFTRSLTTKFLCSTPQVFEAVTLLII